MLSIYSVVSNTILAHIVFLVNRFFSPADGEKGGGIGRGSEEYNAMAAIFERRKADEEKPGPQGCDT